MSASERIIDTASPSPANRSCRAPRGFHLAPGSSPGQALDRRFVGVRPSRDDGDGRDVAGRNLASSRLAITVLLPRPWRQGGACLTGPGPGPGRRGKGEASGAVDRAVDRALSGRAALRCRFPSGEDRHTAVYGDPVVRWYARTRKDGTDCRFGRPPVLCQTCNLPNLCSAKTCSPPPAPRRPCAGAWSVSCAFRLGAFRESSSTGGKRRLSPAPSPKTKNPPVGTSGLFTSSSDGEGDLTIRDLTRLSS